MRAKELCLTQFDFLRSLLGGNGSAIGTVIRECSSFNPVSWDQHTRSLAALPGVFEFWQSLLIGPPILLNGIVYLLPGFSSINRVQEGLTGDPPTNASISKT